MKFKHLSFLPLIFALHNTPAHCEEVYINTTLVTDAAVKTKSGEAQKIEQAINTDIEYSITRDIRLRSTLNVSYFFEDELLLDREHPNNYSSWSKPIYINHKTSVDLRELYLEIYHDTHFIKLGKQQVSWGETDGFRVLDILNPIDYSEFILEDIEDARIPIWMLNYSLPVGENQLQLVFIPDSTHSLIPDGDFAPSSRKNSPFPLQDDEVLTGIQLNDPSTGIKHCDFAMNYSGSLEANDFSIIFIRQYEDNGVLAAHSTGTNSYEFIQNFYQHNVWGASYSRSISNWVLRGEAALSSGRYFYLKDRMESNQISKQKEFNYSLAVDWSGIEDGVVTFQLYQSILPSLEEELTRDKIDTSIGVIWDQDFYNQEFHLNSLILLNTNDGDWMSRTNLDWFIKDNLELQIGLDVFGGDSDGLFGQYHEQNRATFRVKYTF